MKSVDGLVSSVLAHYELHGRMLPWRLPDDRGFFDPYKITVSEIMLQQTQVPRVLPKYEEFLSRFPDVKSLAEAPLKDVLIAWQGLGYNRRAKFLWQTAQKVVNDYAGIFPDDQEELTRLPGIGWNTAGAICAYAFNKPALFIETNVRAVFIHHCFADQENVADKDIIPLLRQALDGQNPRLFYWALMDYGVHIKARYGNAAARSKHYVKQTAFQGSRRQLRGAILRSLSKGPAPIERLEVELSDSRLHEVLEALAAEGLIENGAGTIRLAS